MSGALQYLLGALLILYGILKIGIGLIAILLTGKEREKVSNVPIIKYIISGDSTMSGKMFDVALMLFGLFSVVHGLHFIDILPRPMHFMMYNGFTYGVYAMLGMFLTIYFLLVLFTNVHIPKDDVYRERYMVEGLGSGIMFLNIGAFLILYHAYVHKDGKGLPFPWAIMLGISIPIGLYFLVHIFIDAYKFNKQDNDKRAKQDIRRTSTKQLTKQSTNSTRWMDVMSIAMIPLNVV